MRPLASLRSRVFLAAAGVSILSLALGLRFAARRIDAGARLEARRGLEESARLVVENHQARFEGLVTLARLIADLPRLKAAVATGDGPTVAPVAEDYRRRAGADVLLVADAGGRLLAALGATGTSSSEASALAAALAGHEVRGFEIDATGVTERVSVPLVVGPDPPEVLGAVCLGFRLDDALAARYGAVTGSEVALAVGGRIWASTLPRSHDAALASAGLESQRASLRLGDTDYDLLRQPLAPDPAGQPGAVAVVLRSRAQGRRLIETLRESLLQAGAVAVLVAVLLSFLVAGSVARPLAALTRHMREITATGDLTRRLELPGRGHDEDARLLATTFNTLTDAISRSQREAAQRERLSALGRLSAVVAHEVRNPLMVIKAALRTLRRGPAPAEAEEAVADIDHEVGRIDRIVADVLDVARPPRVEPGPVDLDELCRAAAASLAGDGCLDVGYDLDPAAASVWTDAERLRTVLVNLLSNARDAVAALPHAPAAPGIRILTRREPSGATRVCIEDDGAGLDPQAAGAWFEPFVTTKPQGTGLGLAIARSSMEALGGELRLDSRPGGPTRAVVVIPPRPPGAPGADR